jgi:hypothetical protein
MDVQVGAVKITQRFLDSPMARLKNEVCVRASTQLRSGNGKT